MKTTTQDRADSGAQSASDEPISRRDQRKRDTRARLERAAVDLFVQAGYDDTSYDDIAREAGVARQTAFNHFPRKEDFVSAWVVERRVELQAALNDDVPEDANASTRLLIAMRVMCEIYERMPDEARALMRAWIRLGGPMSDPPVAAEIFASLVREGQELGEFVRDLDPDAVGRLMRAAYNDVLWRWADPSPPASGKFLFHTMLEQVQMLLTGICVEDERNELRRSLALVRATHAPRG